MTYNQGEGTGIDRKRRTDEARISRLVLGGAEVAVISVQAASGEQLGCLTDAERHVCVLIARGYSNGEIARERGTSERTIANQAASIYRKLSVMSRHELVALLAGSPV